MCGIYINDFIAICVFSCPITARGIAHGLIAAFVLPSPGIMVAGCVSASGYFVFGGEDMANQTTSHMKGSSRSI